MRTNLAHVRFEGRPARTWADSAPRHSARLEHAGARPSPPPVSSLPALVLALAGLDPAAYKARPLERRVGACLRRLKVDDEAAAAARLAAQPRLRREALSTLLIGVSAFFRDPPVFELLRHVVAPALRARLGRIRVWSVGCSTGAELYSVAMLLADAGLLERSVLLGTDCRADAVDAARIGVFAEHELDGVDEGMRARHFEPAHGGWRVREPLRRATAWRLADATRTATPGPWDIVLCRNLVIYLEPAATDLVFRRLVATLSPHGFVVVGKAERPPAQLGLSTVGRCVYRSHGDD